MVHISHYSVRWNQAKSSGTHGGADPTPPLFKEKATTKGCGSSALQSHHNAILGSNVALCCMLGLFSVACNVIKCSRGSQHLPIWVASACRTTLHALWWQHKSSLVFLTLLSSPQHNNVQSFKLCASAKTNKPILDDDPFLYARLKNGTYYAVAMSVRPSVPPSVRPSVFSGLFFNMLWDINLKLGIYIR